MQVIFIHRLVEMMGNPDFQRENLEESMAALGITMEIRTFKPLHKPTQLQPHQTIAANWMAEKENSLAKGGLLADNCSTGKVRPCCFLELYCSPH
jgi:SNF2 family DNA or RNA helicase